MDDRSNVVGLYKELDGLDLADLIALFEAPCPSEDDYAQSWFEELGFAIGAHDPDGITYLLDSAAAADELHLGPILLGVGGSKIKRRAAQSLLRSSLSDDREHILCCAIQGLAYLKDRRAQRLILPFEEHPSGRLVGAACVYLALLLPVRSIPYLLAGLRDSRATVRFWAVNELDNISQDEAHGFFLEVFPLLEDPDDGVRVFSHYYLSHWWWGDERGYPEDSLQASEPRVRASAIWSSLQRNRVDSETLVLTALDDPAPVVRVTMIDVCADGHQSVATDRPEVWERVQELRSDPDPFVRAAAELAVSHRSIST